jgi:hypothetical protein
MPRDNARVSQAGVTQLVECNLAKVDVAGSNPVSRSIFGCPELYANIGGDPNPEYPQQHLNALAGVFKVPKAWGERSSPSSYRSLR